MNDRWKPHKALFPALAIAPPALMFLAFKFIAAPGPSAASASSLSDLNGLPQPAGESPLTDPTDAQRAAAEHNAAFEPFTITESPLLALVAAPTIDIPEPIDPILDEFPRIRLTSILGGASAIAVIDSRPMRVGDILADIWEITSIDATSGIVSFRHVDTGDTHQISLRDQG